MKNLGGVLRKESTPGMPLAVAIASGMAVVQQVLVSAPELPLRVVARTSRCADISAHQQDLSTLQASRCARALLLKARLSVTPTEQWQFT